MQAFIAAYDTLHLSLGYDGNPSAKVAKIGLECAEQIINGQNKKQHNNSVSFLVSPIFAIQKEMVSSYSTVP